MLGVEVVIGRVGGRLKKGAGTGSANWWAPEKGVKPSACLGNFGLGGGETRTPGPYIVN